MSDFCKEHELKKAAEDDLATLVDFDKRGLLIGSTENSKEYVNRLKVFQKNLSEMETGLKKDKKFTVEDLTFPASEKIPEKTFNTPAKITSDLYDFKIDWVPGFYITPDFGMLFGGCAYSFDPDFFSLFIIRNSFKKKNKWLFYERDELMSHELCHVARFALKSNTYEEMFAYQTSTSGFRRKFGSMMRAAWETYLFMAILLGMLVTQVSLIIFYSKWLASRSIIENPVHWFYAALFSLVSFLALRQSRQNKLYKKTLKNFEAITNKPRALAFRLNDKEMDSFVKMKDISKDSFIETLKSHNCSDIRLKIITERFLL
ncbi:MAG: hypothetical protein NE330_14180 [Lentisphaeraceae bacterium]|nr:hypothetical protein [Lentisphaeraceae bacterium]